MSTTRVSCHVNAPRSRVYAALLDANAVAHWMVPHGMSSHVHEFDGRQGGRFRISLTYTDHNAAGKSAAHTDTHHGEFVRLVPDREVVQVVEFESADVTLQGAMTITYTLVDAPGGTRVDAVHEHLPPGVSAADNELGWRMSLGKLAALLETGPERT